MTRCSVQCLSGHKCGQPVLVGPHPHKKSKRVPYKGDCLKELPVFPMVEVSPYCYWHTIKHTFLEPDPDHRIPFLGKKEKANV